MKKIMIYAAAVLLVLFLRNVAPVLTTKGIHKNIMPGFTPTECAAWENTGGRWGIAAACGEEIKATQRVVFVCTGNTCRSPMAEGIAKKTAEENNYDLEIISRGTKLDPAEVTANPNAIIVMADRGIKISGHKSLQMSAEDARNANLILTMTDSHKKNVLALFPEAEPYTFTLIEYATGAQGNISDPWGLSLTEYNSTAEQLEALIPAALEKFAGR